MPNLANDEITEDGEDEEYDWLSRQHFPSESMLILRGHHIDRHRKTCEETGQR